MLEFNDVVTRVDLLNNDIDTHLMEKIRRLAKKNKDQYERSRSQDEL